MYLIAPRGVRQLQRGLAPNLAARARCFACSAAAPPQTAPAHPTALPPARQIKFPSPVTITGISVWVPPDDAEGGAPAPPHPPTAVIRAWARDLGCPAAARFPQLLPRDGTLGCHSGGGLAAAGAAEVRGRRRARPGRGIAPVSGPCAPRERRARRARHARTRAGQSAAHAFPVPPSAPRSTSPPTTWSCAASTAPWR